MIYSTWGGYVPVGGLGAVSQPQGSTGGSSGPVDWASLYSPEAVNAYGSTTAGFLNAIFGHGASATPPPTTGSSTPWLLIGGVLVVGVLAYKFLIKR